MPLLGVIGICAMDTKARSKPMLEILNRLISTGDFQVTVFGDKVILDEPIENWPRVDFLISFFSKGFPLEKAIDYVHLRNPICLNDLPMQQLLLDRRLVLALLDAVGVLTPKRLVTWHKDCPMNLMPEVKNKADKLGVHIERLEKLSQSAHLVGEGKEAVVVTSSGTPTTAALRGAMLEPSTILRKPFVEKPVCGEDHNIFIYYDNASGGGVRKLFRKKGNKSSEYFPGEGSTLRDGTVGTEPIVGMAGMIQDTQSYIYEEFMAVDNAEDVKVYTIGQSYAHAETRKSPVVDGIVRRNAEGKEIRFVTELSTQERTIARRVCHVFGQTICGFDLLRAGGKSYVIDVNGWSFVKGNVDYYDSSAQIIREIFLKEMRKRGGPGGVMVRQLQSSENQWKMKAFLSVMRHGDRTPKQKVKFTFVSRAILDLVKDGDEEIVFKKEEQFQIVMAAIRIALTGGTGQDQDDIATTEAEKANLEQVLNILEAKGKLQGTKVQLRPLSDRNSTTSLLSNNVHRVQVIVKWGGLFTHGGLHHSRELGINLRTDLNIISKSLIQDIQVLSSSERRVIDTAETMVSALLNIPTLDSELILVTKEMLDDSNAAKEQTDQVKRQLQAILNPDVKEAPPSVFVMPEGWSEMAGPVQELVELLRELRTLMTENLKIPMEDVVWCCYETPFLFRERWEKLFRDFCDVERTRFESSKISELYDALKFDLLHNKEYLSYTFKNPLKPEVDLTGILWKRSKALFDVIGPHEYGISDKEKLDIGFKNSQHLLKHITDQLLTAQDSPQPLTRLYFTKESKVYSLLNVVLLCGLKTKVIPTDIQELDYLTQITFELYERSAGTMTAGGSSPEDKSGAAGDDLNLLRTLPEHSLRIGFSPGAHDPNLIELQLDNKHSMSVQPRKWLTDHIPLEEALKLLTPPDAFPPFGSTLNLTKQ